MCGIKTTFQLPLSAAPPFTTGAAINRDPQKSEVIKVSGVLRWRMMPLLLSFSIGPMYHPGRALIINSEDYRLWLSQRREPSALFGSGVIQQRGSWIGRYPPPPPRSLLLRLFPSLLCSFSLSPSLSFISFMLAEGSSLSWSWLTLIRSWGPF